MKCDSIRLLGQVSRCIAGMNAAMHVLALITAWGILRDAVSQKPIVHFETILEPLKRFFWAYKNAEKVLIEPNHANALDQPRVAGVAALCHDPCIITFSAYNLFFLLFF